MTTNIDDLIRDTKIIDFGIIQAIHEGEPVTVDVQRAILQKDSSPTISKGVDVLWPTVVNWDLIVDDTVLLIDLSSKTMAVPIGMSHGDIARKLRISDDNGECVLFEALNGALLKLTKHLGAKDAGPEQVMP